MRNRFMAAVLLILSPLLAMGQQEKLPGSFQTTVIDGVKVTYFVPRELTPELIGDGRTLINAVPTAVYIANPVAPAVPMRVPAPAQSVAGEPEKATATFSITYIPDGQTDLWGVACSEFPAEAKAAFNAAAGIWANLIRSTVPITIRAGWADLGSSSTLGYSGGGELWRDFSGAPKASTWYSVSLANSFNGSDLNTAKFDMHITYNKNFSWYFGTDGNTPSGKYDFMSVVLHEIAHGLNFAGSMKYTAGTGSWGYGTADPKYPNIYDTLVRDGSGTALTNTTTYPNPSTALGSALTSTSLWFHGPKAMTANSGQKVKIYAPSSWASGSSYAHLDYDAFAGTANRLMVYAMSSATSIHDPGPVTKGLLADVGWVFPTGAAKAITAFNFSGLTPAVTGIVNESAHAIALTVPFGTDVTALVPTITITGASVNPASGIAQNFTSPVIYTVTATDASTQAYTATVTISPPARAITMFDFNGLTPAVIGEINEGAHTIALTVPFGTDVTALMPTITITGASVSPASGIAQNFTSSVTYTVTASDTSTQAYIVTVTVSPLPGLMVTSPNGGEIWQNGSVHNITWTTTGTVANVKIEYSTNTGGAWTTIIPSIANTNTYAWTLPLVVSPNCLIRVSEAASGNPMDVSDAVFSIIVGTPTIGLSKTSFNFGTERNGTPTPGERVVISNTAGGTLNWTATPSTNWIAVSPGSKTGAGTATISISRTDMTAGPYTGTIAITAPGATNTPQTITINLNVKTTGSDSPPFGNFATPTTGTTVASSVPVTGWALDDIGMKSVKIYRGTNTTNRIYIGDAIFVEGARPDVKKAYPTYPQNSRAGWGYMLLTNFLPNGGNGTFTLLAYAKDTGDHEVLLGSKTITCDNAHAVKPFGAIDTPSQGGTALGASFVNFGWALTPQPNSIPTNGSTIWAYIDGVASGHPVYNNYRKDIANLFPGYTNSNAAIGYYYINTTGYADGVHTIAWSVTDTGGNGDGIGSRYFSIQNAGGSAGAEEAGKKETDDSFRNTETRSADEIASIPEDGWTPVFIKRGWGNDKRAEMVYPETDGSIRIEIPEVSRVAIYLNPEDAGEAVENTAVRGRRILNKSGSPDGRFKAYERVGGELLPLPIGASFDASKGVLFWQPGLGFLGEYQFVIVDLQSHTKKTVTLLIV